MGSFRSLWMPSISNTIHLVPSHCAVWRGGRRNFEKYNLMAKPGFPDRSALWVVVLLAVASCVACIDDKCGACSAVAGELEIGLSNEKPRNHLDMRHRLDSKGQREGKLIDYRVSELRIVELLDGLCEKVQDYTFEKLDSGKRAWIKVADWDNYTLNVDKQEARAYSKDISSYCGKLLEETEDGLAEIIKRGSVGPSDMRRVLCEDLSKHCGKSRTEDKLSDKDYEL